MADSEGICEAAQRPTMRFVKAKSAEAGAVETRPAHRSPDQRRPVDRRPGGARQRDLAFVGGRLPVLLGRVRRPGPASGHGGNDRIRPKSGQKSGVALQRRPPSPVDQARPLHVIAGHFEIVAHLRAHQEIGQAGDGHKPDCQIA